MFQGSSIYLELHWATLHNVTNQQIYVGCHPNLAMPISKSTFAIVPQ